MQLNDASNPSVSKTFFANSRSVMKKSLAGSAIRYNQLTGAQKKKFTFCMLKGKTDYNLDDM
jgi:hypothetical protein